MIKQKTGNITNRLFLSYAVTFIIPLLVMGIFSYFWMGGIIREQNEKVYADNLENVKSELEGKFADLDNFSYTIARTQWMQVLVYLPGPGIDADRMDPITLNNHLSELGNYKSMNGFIENLAVYMYNTGVVIYPGGVDNFDWFFEHTYKFDGKDKQYWHGMVKNLVTDNASAFIGAAPVFKYTTRDDLYVYVKALPMRIGKPCAAIFYTIRKDTIEALLERVKTTEDSSVYLYDQNNTLLASVNAGEDKQALVGALLRKGGPLPRQVRDGQGRDYFLYSVESGRWKYISLLPQQDILSEVQFIKNITLAISGFLLLAGVLISYGIALKNYSPVKKLASLVRSGLQQTEEKTGNEYELIESGIRSAIRREAELTESMGKYKTILLKDLMEKLLDGQIKDAGGDYRRELAQQGFARKLFGVAILETGEGLNQAQEMLCGQDWSTYMVQRENRLIAIVNCDGNQTLQEAVARLGGLCRENVSTIGVGNLSEAEGVYRSYNEARIALDYELLKGKGTVIHYSDIDIAADKTYHYPVFFDERFVQSMQDRDFKVLRMYFERSLRFYISQSSLPLSIERLLFYKRVLLEMEKLPQLSFERLMDELRGELAASATIDEVQACVENTWKDIFRSAVRQRETYSNELIENILKYIGDNYADSSLSLTRVADRFKMNHSKLSVFFKEQTGENFIDYLSRKRVNVAKELLASDGLTIEQIGIQVGFDSVHTFRRVFKKYEVLTPGQFRDAGQ